MQIRKYSKAIAASLSAAGIIASSGTLTGEPELILNAALSVVGAVAVFALRNTGTTIDVPQASSPLGTATVKVVADLSEFEQQLKSLVASIRHAKPADVSAPSATQGQVAPSKSVGTMPAAPEERPRAAASTTPSPTPDVAATTTPDVAPATPTTPATPQ